MKHVLTILLALILSLNTFAANKIKVACVGNSVTYGYNINDREVNCYPAQLAQMLGNDYDVRNFGHSGATLLRKGHRPYNTLDEYHEAIDFAADYVIIHLGLNDTDPRDWPNYDYQFIGDYVALIDSFRIANPKSKVMICRMTPIFHTHPRFKSGTRDWYWEVQSAIEQVADITGCTLLDFHKDLYSRPDLMPDALHPTATGATFLAETVRGAITGDFGGLKLADIYTDGMVLQRDTPLTISGTANAGQLVTLSFAGHKGEATASAADGSWSITLPALHASANPETLSVSTKDCRLAYNDILVGDVWLCSGQSNMAFMTYESMPDEYAAQKQYASTDHNIRLYDMKARWLTDDIIWTSTTLDSIKQRQYYAETCWRKADPITAAWFSAIGFSFGRELADSLNIPIGLICNAIGGAPTESWVDRKTLEFDFPDILNDFYSNDFIQPWVRKRALFNTSASSYTNPVHPYQPAYLFEAGIEPLNHLAIKGVIWYQGESNAHNIEAHEQLFTLLTKSWRNYWHNDRLPFIFVQLSSINRPSWPKFRDSQRRLADKISDCYMAVSSDLGDSLNVHPRHKIAIGQRLARQALNHIYGRTDITPEGPKPAKIERDGNALIITFDNGKDLRSSDSKPVRTFEIAQQPGMYHAATADILPDGRLRITAEGVNQPRYIRYAWQPFTRANLINSDSLPASTFTLQVPE
jgi:sialate O-acetylesterase